jgi:hypothetical protein
MKIHKVGEKSKAACVACKALRSTTFRERDVPLRSGGGTVRDVLVAVCDTCGTVVGIPHQSVPRVAETVRHVRRGVEARIPRHLSDVAALVCHELGGGPDATAIAFRYYLERAATRRLMRANLPALAGGPEASGRATARFSAKLDDEAYEHLRRVEKATRLKTTGVVKGLIVQMKHDILDRRGDVVRRDLRRILKLAG